MMDTPRPGTAWRHKKRGSVYRIVSGRAFFQWSGNALVETELENTFLTVYVAATGQVFVRPTREFMDGRFEPFPAGDQF